MAIPAEIKETVQTLTGVSFTKAYTPPKPVRGKTVVGFNEGTFKNVDSQYRVTIENKDWIVNAWLQDNFEFDVNSDWGALISSPSDMLKGLAKGISDTQALVTKALSGKTLKNVAMTHRKWEGSSPLSINLRLKFRAYDNAKIEVLQACQALQAMVLPSEMGIKLPNNSPLPGFLVPPGPGETYISSKFEKNYKLFGNNFSAFSRNDNISLKMFGGKFFLDMCIVKSASVSFDPKMTKDGPVAAEVNIKLESYEMLTKEKLGKIYEGSGYINEGLKSGGVPSTT